MNPHDQRVLRQRAMIRRHIENLSTQSLIDLLPDAEIIFNNDENLPKDAKLRQMILSLGLKDSDGHIDIATDYICYTLALRYVKSLTK